jgi:predicted O-linked N-acetylglucosamine transferase (SPINDLY family)
MADPSAAFAAAVAAHQAGDLAAAERAYRSLLADHPGHAPALCNLGVLLVRAGNFDEAERCYTRALAAEPGYPDAHFNLGNLYRRANRLAEAADHYQKCLAGNPTHAAAAYNLGLVCAAAGRFDAAADCYRAVVRLEPRSADGHRQLGDALVRSGHAADGLAALRRAVELQPAEPRNLLTLGLGLLTVGNLAEAHEVLQKALKLKPDYAEAHNTFGLALEQQGRKDDALFHYQESVRLKPDLADGWSNIGTNLSEQGRIAEAIPCLRQSLAIRPNAPPIHSNLLLTLNYPSGMPPEQVRDEHLAWAGRFAGPTPDRPPVPPPHDPDRRLKVGYLSADYRTHTVAGFIETLLRHHDRSRVEVFAYASVHRPDETTEKLRPLADQWRPIGGMPDDQAADLIRSDGIDCLVDLGGHTAGNRLLVLARRPAPVQATLFGYPNTTGMTAVDYRITDPVSDPPGLTEHLYVEGLLRLPETAWVYAPQPEAAAVGPLPSAAKKTFTFGCLNNAAKVSDQCLEAWARILREVPGTRLVLMAGQAQAGAKRLAGHQH